jgi:hypothetical protein
MTPLERLLNPATRAYLSLCSLNLYPALQKKPSCPCKQPLAMASIASLFATLHRPSTQLLRSSATTPPLDAVENP